MLAQIARHFAPPLMRDVIRHGDAVQRTKRQHYVPQFLLRHFSATAEKNRVWCFDKFKREARLQAIRDSAQETRFYDHPDIVNVGIDLEERLAAFEGQVAPILSDIVGSRSLLSVTLERRAALLDFALVQLFRTRAAREFAKQGSLKLSNQAISEEIAQQCSLAALLRDFAKYRQCCSRHIMTLREAVPPEEFYLGDAVTLVMRTADGPMDSLRAILPSATICLPVSASLALMFFSGIREVDLADAGAWYRPEVRVLTEPQPNVSGDAASINTMSVIAANRFVYSATANFEHCEEVVAANPDSAFGPIGGWTDRDGVSGSG